MSMDDKKKRIKLAEDVVRLSRNTLLVNLRFMDVALSRLKLTSSFKLIAPFATDAQTLLYSPNVVLQIYMREREEITREYLHTVFHCVFHHPFVGDAVDNDVWNLACDIAVENALTELDLSSVRSKREAEQKPEIEYLKKKVSLLTAERLYRFFMDQHLSKHRIAALRQFFLADDHFAWYLPPQAQSGNGEGTDSEGIQTGSPNDDNLNKDSEKNASGDEGSDNENSDGNHSSDTQGSGNGIIKLHRPYLSSAEDWKNVSHRTQIGIEAFGKQQGYSSGNMMQNLRTVTREKYDYSSFLKRFAVIDEAMKINDEEFDYIFYTYGLNRYGNMPLIEPLEYKELKRIKEFVIAIDTSASVAGEPVQKFIQKTYSILKSTESFSRKINLHIIQCDAEIQEDAKITSQTELDEYIRRMELKGFGGTDFRPVFQYVEKMRGQGELSQLKGLLYFTDGYGSFPERKPNYETAFVFLSDNYNDPAVPPWAIKIILNSEEL